MLIQYQFHQYDPEVCSPEVHGQELSVLLPRWQLVNVGAEALDVGLGVGPAVQAAVDLVKHALLDVEEVGVREEELGAETLKGLDLKERELRNC